MSYHTLTKGLEAKTVVLLGMGNVGSHLAKVLRQVPGYRLMYHYSRSLGMNIQDIPRHADLYIFAVSDTALPMLWAEMPATTGVWIHTAGAVSLDSMLPYHSRVGVLYPLQTISKGRVLDWTNVPIYYEGDDECRLLAEALSEHTAYADSEGRSKLHLAAVLACNYSNYLVSLAEEYLGREGFEPKALLPLLNEMVAKFQKMPANKAQTGPAIRGDRSTINKHLELLNQDEANAEALNVYTLLAEALLKRGASQV